MSFVKSSLCYDALHYRTTYTLQPHAFDVHPSQRHEVTSHQSIEVDIRVLKVTWRSAPTSQDVLLSFSPLHSRNEQIKTMINADFLKQEWFIWNCHILVGNCYFFCSCLYERFLCIFPRTEKIVGDLPGHSEPATLSAVKFVATAGSFSNFANGGESRVENSIQIFYLMIQDFCYFTKWTALWTKPFILCVSKKIDIWVCSLQFVTDTWVKVRDERNVQIKNALVVWNNISYSQKVQQTNAFSVEKYKAALFTTLAPELKKEIREMQIKEKPFISMFDKVISMLCFFRQQLTLPTLWIFMKLRSASEFIRIQDLGKGTRGRGGLKSQRFTFPCDFLHSRGLNCARRRFFALHGLGSIPSKNRPVGPVWIVRRVVVI